MYYLINLFWRWLGLTPESYATEGLKYVNDHMEFDFPYFSELITYAKKIVDKQSTLDSDIDELITIMAIDNESESVLEYLVQNASLVQLDKVINLGVKHLQPEARWQIAELIYRVNLPEYVSLLSALSHDPHPYVKKRAKQCISYFGDLHL